MRRFIDSKNAKAKTQNKWIAVTSIHQRDFTGQFRVKRINRIITGAQTKFGLKSLFDNFIPSF